MERNFSTQKIYIRWRVTCVKKSNIFTFISHNNFFVERAQRIWEYGELLFRESYDWILFWNQVFNNSNNKFQRERRIPVALMHFIGILMSNAKNTTCNKLQVSKMLLSDAYNNTKTRTSLRFLGAPKRSIFRALFESWRLFLGLHFRNSIQSLANFFQRRIKEP